MVEHGYTVHAIDMFAPHLHNTFSAEMIVNASREHRCAVRSVVRKGRKILERRRIGTLTPCCIMYRAKYHVANDTILEDGLTLHQEHVNVGNHLPHVQHTVPISSHPSQKYNFKCFKFLQNCL